MNSSSVKSYLMRGSKNLSYPQDAEDMVPFPKFAELPPWVSLTIFLGLLLAIGALMQTILVGINKLDRFIRIAAAAFWFLACVGLSFNIMKHVMFAVGIFYDNAPAEVRVHKMLQSPTLEAIAIVGSSLLLFLIFLATGFMMIGIAAAVMLAFMVIWFQGQRKAD